MNNDNGDNWQDCKNDGFDSDILENGGKYMAMF
jgi:hypothetical protein